MLAKYIERKRKTDQMLAGWLGCRLYRRSLLVAIAASCQQIFVCFADLLYFLGIFQILPRLFLRETHFLLPSPSYDKKQCTRRWLTASFIGQSSSVTWPHGRIDQIEHLRNAAKFAASGQPNRRRRAKADRVNNALQKKHNFRINNHYYYPL